MYEAGHPKPMLCENPEMPWGGQWGGVQDAEDKPVGRQFILMHRKPS